MALLQFIDGCIEYTKDIFTVPAAKATATGSKVVTTATAVTVEVANQAAGLVGVQNSNIFPNNPYDFNPEGLIRHEYKNGEIIK